MNASASVPEPFLSRAVVTTPLVYGCQEGRTAERGRNGHYLIQDIYSLHIPTTYLGSPYKDPVNQQGPELGVPPRAPRHELNTMMFLSKGPSTQSNIQYIP